MLNKLFIVLFVLLISIPSRVNAAIIAPLAGVYVDNFTGISAKLGVQNIPFGELLLYSDIELGTSAKKLGFGVGTSAGTSWYVTRLGVSVARKGHQNFIGGEGLLSFSGWTVKLGVYHNLDTSNEHVSVGVGYGF